MDVPEDGGEEDLEEHLLCNRRPASSARTQYMY